MWERIRSTADIELLADPFDTWQQFETPVECEPTDNEIMLEAARFEYESVDRSDAF